MTEEKIDSLEFWNRNNSPTLSLSRPGDKVWLSQKEELWTVDIGFLKSENPRFLQRTEINYGI